MTRLFTRGGPRSPFLGEIKRPFLGKYCKPAGSWQYRRGDPPGAQVDRPAKGI